MLPDVSKLFANLASLDPRLPGAACGLVVLAVFSLMYWVRRRFPKIWERCADLAPFLRGDVDPVLAALRKAWQAVPSAVAGAVMTALLSGGNLRAAELGAVLGLLAPVLHELAKWCPWLSYRGEVGLLPTDVDVTNPDTPSSKPPRA